MAIYRISTDYESFLIRADCEDEAVDFFLNMVFERGDSLEIDFDVECVADGLKNQRIYEV